MIFGLVPARPALAGTLASPTFSAPVPFRYVGAQNTGFTWQFTTATVSEVRMTVPTGTTGSGSRYVEMLSGATGNDVTTVDSVANSITGDLELRAQVTPLGWSGQGALPVITKWNSTGNQRSYWFGIDNSGRLTFATSATGAGVTFLTSSVLGIPVAKTWIRVTYQASTGTATFTTSTDGSSWAAQGSATYGSARTPFDGTASVMVGNDPTAANSYKGLVHYAEVRNGIAGTIVNKMDAGDATSPTTGVWTSSTGEAWTVNRSGATRPADIASELLPAIVSGVPTGGTGRIRMIDAAAIYTLTSPTSVPSGTPCDLQLNGFNNTMTAGSYTSVIATYTSTPTLIDSGTTASLAFSVNDENATVSVAVDPALVFTVGSHGGACNGVAQTVGTSTDASTVSLGRVSTLVNAVAAQDLTIMTNAASGYTIYLRSPSLLTSGSGHTIAAIGGSNASPVVFSSVGTAAFGYTTDDATLSGATPDRFTNPSARWAPLSTGDAEVSSSATPPASAETVCVAYQVGVATTTAAGTYTATVVYTAIPTF